MIEIVLLDYCVRPDRPHQLVLAKWRSAVLHQVKQSVKHLWRQRYGRSVARQKALARVNAESAEFIELGRWMGHGFSYLLRNFQETPKTSVTDLDESVWAWFAPLIPEEALTCDV